VREELGTTLTSRRKAGPLEVIFIETKLAGESTTAKF
jgi:hypothetical protein